MSKNKMIAVAVVALVVVGGGSFYGGMKYAQGSSRAGGQFARNGQFGAAGGAGATGANANRRMAGNVVAGEVLSKDANGITVKLTAGGSKIVLLSASSTVSKSAVGTLDDLAVGTQVTVIGTTNTDGSVTAQSIQIRPAGQDAPFMRTTGGTQPR